MVINILLIINSKSHSPLRVECLIKRQLQQKAQVHSGYWVFITGLMKGISSCTEYRNSAGTESETDPGFQEDLNGRRLGTETPLC